MGDFFVVIGEDVVYDKTVAKCFPSSAGLAKRGIYFNYIYISFYHKYLYNMVFINSEKFFTGQ